MQISAEVEGIIFDCDGTLADTMTLHFEAWLQALAPQGVVIERSFIDEHAGRPTWEIVEDINRLFNVKIDPHRFAHEKESLYTAMLDRVQPIEPVVAVAREHRGRLPMGVVSGGLRAVVRQTLVHIGLGDYFPVMVTADDPYRSKPAPEMFLAAAEQLGVDPRRCHVFEDGDPGIAGARAAGMTVTDVRPLLAGKV